MKTASSHNAPLTGKVEPINPLESKYRELLIAHGKQGERIMELEADPSFASNVLRVEVKLLTQENAVLRFDLSRAQERLKKAENESLRLAEFTISIYDLYHSDRLKFEWDEFDDHPDVDSWLNSMKEVARKVLNHEGRLATEDAKPEGIPSNNDPVKPADYELLEATMRLIAEPWRQSDYTPQQLARHVLRIEPLPERLATEDKPEKE